MKITEILYTLRNGGIYQCEEIFKEGEIKIIVNAGGVVIAGGNLNNCYNDFDAVLNRAADKNMLDVEYERYKTRTELKAEITALKAEVQHLKTQCTNAKNKAQHYMNALERLVSEA